MSTLVRIEYLSPQGWRTGHAGIALLDPQRYVDKVFKSGRSIRAFVLDDRLQPTGEPIIPKELDLL